MISSRRRRLLIIHHADEKRLPNRRHLLNLIMPHWQEVGIEVTEVYGTGRAPDADVALLHVDLSIVPQTYLDLAHRYPVAVNGAVPDILKSRLSQLRVTPDSGYVGPVILKTSLNCAGAPEMTYFLNLSKLQRLWLRIRRQPHPHPVYPIPIWEKADYEIYPSPNEVPQAIWECPDLVVEKFMPERHGDRYCLREWYFCGDHDLERVELSPHQVFMSGEEVHHLHLGIPPELRELRKRLGFDFGKFDYTMIDGKPAVFDFNKTPGVGNPQSQSSLALAQTLAAGIESYFN